MANEENKLLVKDLCARLPYGVKIKYHYKRENNVIDEVRELSFSDVETLKYNIEYPQDYWCEISWKPYLRPMNSMTEKEKNEWMEITHAQEWLIIGNLDKATDWLNAHHFDYRDLIEKGLALEAPEWMYEIK